MGMSDIIANFINEILNETDEGQAIIQRNDLANQFNCVPSQINYVISTRFIPELGYYVESRRGGGGYIKIYKINLDKSEYISELLNKIGSTMSQSVVNVYLRELLRYNIIDEKNAQLISAALSDKSLGQVDKLKRDNVRADIFKNIVVNLI